MEVIDTPLAGLKIIETQQFGDRRGFFMETYNYEKYAALGIDQHFVQDNLSKSSYGVVRGLHFQKPPFTQAKLISCVVGEVVDINVDIRRNSPTFGQWYAVRLSAENHRQLLVPHGFAHGFAVLSPTAIFAYKCDNFYHPEAEGGVLPTDLALGIDWLVPAEDMIFSDKDQKHPRLAELISPF